jgi:multidrug efflux pump subunit AcrB
MIIDLLLDAERRQGNAVRVAGHRAWSPLLRRIMMAATAAILGILPLMLGAGIGSELCRPLGLAIVRQVLILFAAPYFYFRRLVAGHSRCRPDRCAGGEAFE